LSMNFSKLSWVQGKLALLACSETLELCYTA
jgi:hypothetical protein